MGIKLFKIILGYIILVKIIIYFDAELLSLKADIETFHSKFKILKSEKYSN